MANRYGFQVRQHKHELYGTCAECQKRNAKKKSAPKSYLGFGAEVFLFWVSVPGSVLVLGCGAESRASIVT